MVCFHHWCVPKDLWKYVNDNKPVDHGHYELSVQREKDTIRYQKICEEYSAKQSGLKRKREELEDESLKAEGMFLRKLAQL